MRGSIGHRVHTWPLADILLTPESSMFQDSAKSTAAVANNDPVGAWCDQRTTLLGPIQATSGKRPLLKTNVLNGYRVVQSDGTDDMLGTTMTASAAQTFIVVAKKASALAAVADALFGINFNSSNRQSFYALLALAGYSWNTNQLGTTTIIGGTVDQWNIIAFSQASASSLTIRVGGGAGVNLDPNDLVTTSVAYTLFADNATSFGDFQMAEFRRYTQNLNFADIDLVCNYLAQRYGLTWTPAA